MRVIAIDVETYPDLFTLSAKEIYTGQESAFYLLRDGSSSHPRGLLGFLEELDVDILVGYNSITFDSPVIHFALDCPDTERISEFANICATNRRKRSESQQVQYVKYAYKYSSPLSGVTHVDLLLIFNKIDRVSLKRIAINLHAQLIQDLPYPPGSLVADKLKEVLSYNMNDVRITADLYVAMYDEIKLRFLISNQYDIDVISSSRSVMGAKIMEKLYLEVHPEIKSYDLRQMRTYRKKLDFSNIISPRVSFKLPNLKDLLQELKDLVITSDDYIKKDNVKFQRDILIGNTTYTMGVGGLHSNNQPKYLYSNENQKIIDADVASFYPSLMLQEKVFPLHLGIEFLKLYERIVEQRLAAKRNGIKTTAEALKITINAVFGKMGTENEWFYDLEALYKVTINGQLFLLMLIEDLTMAGINVFYGNTDGITAIVTPTQEAEFYRICDQWQQKLSLELEYTEIERMMIRDVNNYTLRTTTGYTKEKGDFVCNPPLGKKVDAQIIPIAIREWFYNDVPIDTTIKAEESIKNFIMTGKVGDQFNAVFHTIASDNHQLTEIPLQRVNRYYASNSAGSGSLLKKRKSDDGLENMLKLSQVHICNDFTQPMLPINRQYYINRANRLIAAFQIQQSLF